MNNRSSCKLILNSLMTAKVYCISLSTRSDELASGEFTTVCILFSHSLHLDRDRVRSRSLRFPSRQKKKKRTLGPYIFLEIPSPSVRPLIPAFLSLYLPVRFAQNEQKKKKKSLLFFFFSFFFFFFFFGWNPIPRWIDHILFKLAQKERADRCWGKIRSHVRTVTRVFQMFSLLFPAVHIP